VKLPAGVAVRAGGLWIVLTRGVVALMVGDLVGGFFLARLVAHDSGSDAIVSMVLAFGTIASLTLHELGHAFAARRCGLTVLGVAVRWFGAGTYIDKGYPDGPTAWRVAAAGPAASLATASGSLGLAVVVAPGPVRIGLVGLTAVNLFLCVSNVVPVAPLDGYRVLLGLLWIRRSRVRAERLTVAVGNVLLAALAGGVAYALAAQRPSLALLLGVLLVVFEAQRRVAGRQRNRPAPA
jgi:Zn-dependent protease